MTPRPYVKNGSSCLPIAGRARRSSCAAPDSKWIFIPADIRARLRFQPEITTRLHPLDRVGTYGSTHFAEILP